MPYTSVMPTVSWSFRHVEPALATPPELAGVLTELVQREPLFHRQELGMTRAHFEDLSDEDYWEVGEHGERHCREYVLDTIADRFREHGGDPWRMTEYHCRELAPKLYLLTYTLDQGHRKSRRTTIWRDTAAGWKVLFHQCTPVRPD
jgi:hypothetical protein